MTNFSLFAYLHVGPVLYAVISMIVIHSDYKLTKGTTEMVCIASALYFYPSEVKNRMMFKLFTNNPTLLCSSQIKFGIYFPGWTSIISKIIGSPVSHNQVSHKANTAFAIFDSRAVVEVEIISEKQLMTEL